MYENKILLIEDDDELSYLIEKFLLEDGLDVDSLATITDAISHIKLNNYNLILLDLSLPDFSGFEVLKYLSANNKNIPIIVISGDMSMKTKLHAYRLGVCDYMTKPISLKELKVKIDVFLRLTTKSIFKETNNVFEVFNDIIYFKDNELNLTKVEFKILNILISNKNSNISRDKLCENLPLSTTQRTLDYHINKIRQKISDDGNNSKYLVTQYGAGYKLKF